jgi:hypothetical protein
MTTIHLLDNILIVNSVERFYFDIIFDIFFNARVASRSCRWRLEGEFINRTASGIGLGFAIEDLMRWQLEILSNEVALK